MLREWIHKRFAEGQCFHVLDIYAVKNEPKIKQNDGELTEI